MFSFGLSIILECVWVQFVGNCAPAFLSVTLPRYKTPSKYRATFLFPVQLMKAGHHYPKMLTLQRNLLLPSLRHHRRYRPVWGGEGSRERRVSDK
jgi:hypothetical protein